jgi:predicted kinase
MEAVLLVGVQGSGKSTFCRERFYATHVRINLDMLRTRHRERCFLEVCLETRQRFVVDNTNPTPADRQRYIVPARAAGFTVIGYYLAAQLEDCKRRNDQRPPTERIPLPGLVGTFARLVVPRWDEGFDELYCVTIAEGGFAVAPLAHDV